jgi:transcriptional regulator of acetoin/glycerol metabolism
VRQLGNVLRAAALGADGCAEIDAAHLGEDFASPPPAAAPEAAPALPRGTLEDAELALIRAAVEAAGGNISAASKRLGIARNTIYRRLRWNAGH